jgi:hypothetical protein
LFPPPSFPIEEIDVRRPLNVRRPLGGRFAPLPPPCFPNPEVWMTQLTGSEDQASFVTNRIATHTGTLHLEA